MFVLKLVALGCGTLKWQGSLIQPVSINLADTETRFLHQEKRN